MDKYIIVNEAYNSILCKDKNGSRRYRQDQNNIDKNCVIIKTTKGRAEQERDYLNKNYNKGWEIQKVEPIVFYDNAENREKYLAEYETLNKEEIKQIKKETAKEFVKRFTFNLLNNSVIDDEYTLEELEFDGETIKETLNDTLKQFSVEVEK